MKHNKPTVTIGIPAYNEEGNISTLLNSILSQTSKLYDLKKIIVINDASTDDTASIVRKKVGQNRLIKLINGQERNGKAKRLNQIYDINKSDILITLDGDVYLGTNKEIDKAVRLFRKNSNLLVCSLRNIPIHQKTIIGKTSNASYFLWQEMARSYKRGQNIHTSLGSATAIRKELVDVLRYPSNTIADQGYLFIKTQKKQKNAYKFIDNSVVYFKAVNTLSDYFRQGKRAIYSDKHNIADTLGKEALINYAIPFSIKFKSILKQLSKDPVFTMMALFLSVLIRLIPKEVSTEKGIWDIAISSK